MTRDERLRQENVYREQLATLEKMKRQYEQQINSYEELLQVERRRLRKLERFSFIKGTHEKKDRLLVASLEVAAVQEDLRNDFVGVIHPMNALDELYRH